MSEQDFRLDNPILVRWEFASEERLEKRNALYRELVEGVDAEEMLFQEIKELGPTRVLEVGCGAGAMAQRVRDELGAQVVAVDSSERMIELTRQREIESYVFHTSSEMREFVAANITRAHLAGSVPEFDEPVHVRTHHTIFVADKAA